MNQDEKLLIYLLSKEGARARPEFKNQLIKQLAIKEQFLINNMRKEHKMESPLKNNRLKFIGSAAGISAIIIVATLGFFWPSNPESVNNTQDDVRQEQTNCPKNYSEGPIEDSMLRADCVYEQEFSSIGEAAAQVAFKVYAPQVDIDPRNLVKATVSQVEDGPAALYMLFEQNGLKYQINHEEQVFEATGTEVSIRFDGKNTPAQYTSYNEEGKASSALSWSSEGITYSISVDQADQKDQLIRIASSMRVYAAE
jgi:hypothetical protein